jgi:hypothetical protein
MNRIKAWLNRPVSKHSDGLEWRITTAQPQSRVSEHGNVSLREEGEAWKGTLCHGPNDCSS